MCSERTVPKWRTLEDSNSWVIFKFTRFESSIAIGTRYQPWDRTMQPAVHLRRRFLTKRTAQRAGQASQVLYVPAVASAVTPQEENRLRGCSGP